MRFHNKQERREEKDTFPSHEQAQTIKHRSSNSSYEKLVHIHPAMKNAAFQTVPDQFVTSREWHSSELGKLLHSTGQGLLLERNSANLAAINPHVPTF